MPTVMDPHKGADLPTAVRSSVERRVRSGEEDEFGLVDRGVIFDRDGGTMHCVLEAPDEEAVRRHHERGGVALAAGAIHRAEAILR